MPIRCSRNIPSITLKPCLAEYCTSVGGIEISALLGMGCERPVVFLHGNSSSKNVWANQLKLICSHGRPVLAPDFPGHGKSGNSSTPASTYSFPGYAAVISGLLDGLRWDCADLVGWSLGGHVGLELLATEPRIHSLLIVGTPPVRLRPESLHEAFYADENMLLAGKSDFSETDTIRYGTALMGGRKYLTSTLLDDIRRADGNSRRWMFSNSLQGIGSDQRHTAENVDKSLCIVHGGREPFVRLDYLRSLNYRALWKGNVQVMSNAGHAPHWEFPRAFNQILLGFLECQTLTQETTVDDIPRLQNDTCSSDSG